MAQTGVRARQTQLTRELILEAVGEFVAEGQVLDFSVQEVADRAGVSHRTVYRHFENRDALIDGVVERLVRRILEEGGDEVPGRAEEIGDDIRRSFRLYDRYGAVVAPLVRIGAGGEVRRARTQRRTRAVLRSLEDVTGGLDPEVAEAVSWTIRHLTSGNTWMVLREDGGIDGERSGEAVAWAVDTLLDALKNGQGPGARTAEGDPAGGKGDGHTGGPSPGGRSRGGRRH